MRALAKDPGARYQDARAFQQAIELELLRQAKPVGSAEIAELMAEQQEGTLVLSPEDAAQVDAPIAPIRAEPLGGLQAPTALVRIKVPVPIDEQPTVTTERIEE